MNIDKLKFDKDGLIPAIVTDSRSKELLTLAYMNKESLQITINEGRTCFYSRSRKTLWRKGESSGNYQNVVKITADCDYDALHISVDKKGPACHTGNDSCFFYNVFGEDSDKNMFSIDLLAKLIKDRKQNPKEGSYTNYLFEKGLDKILKKIGEESTEVIIAAKAGDKADTIYEIADLAYHIVVLMTFYEIEWEEIKDELASRHIMDKKVKQEKMT